MRPSGGLALDAARSYAALVGVPSSCADGRLQVAPGAPDDSYLLHKLTGERLCGGNQMPLGGSSISAAQIETIRGWICGGARND